MVAVKIGGGIGIFWSGSKGDSRLLVSWRDMVSLVIGGWLKESNVGFSKAKAPKTSRESGWEIETKLLSIMGLFFDKILLII